MLLSASIFSRNRTHISLHLRPCPQCAIWIEHSHWSILEFLVCNFPQTSYTEHIVHSTLSSLLYYLLLEYRLHSEVQSLYEIYTTGLKWCKKHRHWTEELRHVHKTRSRWDRIGVLNCLQMCSGRVGCHHKHQHKWITIVQNPWHIAIAIASLHVAVLQAKPATLLLLAGL